MYGRLMNVIIVRSKTRGSPRWKEKTMMLVCSSKLDIPLHNPLYHLQYPWFGFYIRWMQILFSRIIEQIAYEEQPQGFEIYQKENLVCRWEKTTWWRTSNAQQKSGENISITKILHQNGYSEVQDDGFLIHDKLSWWQKKCYMDMFQFDPCQNVMS